MPRFSELPGLVAGWSDPLQIARNGNWFDQLLTRLLETTALKHVTLLQGTKAYGASVKPIRVPAREDHPRVEHPNFYWLQEDRLKAAHEASGLQFTILRPQLIVGPNQGVVMNLPPVVTWRVCSIEAGRRTALFIPRWGRLGMGGSGCSTRSRRLCLGSRSSQCGQSNL